MLQNEDNSDENSSQLLNSQSPEISQNENLNSLDQNISNISKTQNDTKTSHTTGTRVCGRWRNSYCLLPRQRLSNPTCVAAMPHTPSHPHTFTHIHPLDRVTVKDFIKNHIRGPL